MKLKNYFTAYCFVLLTLFLNAQESTLKKADAQFNKFAFVDAAKTYKKLLDNEAYANHATRKLADCYAYMRNPDSAVVYYEKAVQQEGVPIAYFYRYAQALRGIKDYEASRIWLKKFFDAGGEINQSQIGKDREFLNSIFNAEHQYFLDEVSFNSKYSDFGAYENNGKLYFTSSRDEGVAIKRRYGWNKEPFLDVYVVDKEKVDSVSINHTHKVKGQVNSVYHDGPVTITNDGKTMYFSRTNFIKNTLSRDRSGVSNLKIYKAMWVDNKWTNIEELPFNDDTYSNGHPALNQDGTKLYFASNRPGGFGGTDLYYVDINPDGTYGKPQNLGSVINTNKNERFPFVNNEGTLFFSSDGHHGLGMLDIFVAVYNDNNDFVNVINLGVPVNSSKDDFSFFMNEDGTNGYFASNRSGGMGSDDIYAFNRIKRIKLEGTVYDSENNTPISNAIITLMDANGKEIASFKTDENGSYQMNINRDEDYVVNVAKEGYYNKTTTVTSKGLDPQTKSITADFSLQPSIKEESEAAITELAPIYFNFDSAEIRPQETTELDRVVEILNEYPEMRVEIQSHCDSRGPAAYNLKLSEKRALSTYNYLVAKGISPTRIASYKGYGEEKLVNGCDGTIKCTEAQHALNRRTNFIVIKEK